MTSLTQAANGKNGKTATDALPEGVIAKTVVISVLVNSIRAYKGQPREYFDSNKIEAIGESIQNVEQQDPVILRRVTDDPNPAILYELVGGETRWRACKLKGILRIDAIVREYKDEIHQFYAAAVGNATPTQHTPLEYARIFKRLISELPELRTMTAAARHQRLGKDFGGYKEKWVRDHLSLNNLDPRVQERLKLTTPKSERMALVIAFDLAQMVKGHDDQYALAEEIMAKKLRHRKARLLIKKFLKGKPQEAAGDEDKRGKKGRSPYDDYRTLAGSLDHFDDTLARLGDIKFETLTTVLEKRSLEERDSLTDKIDSAIQRLTDLKTDLTSAYEIIDLDKKH